MRSLVRILMCGAVFGVLGFGGPVDCIQGSLQSYFSLGADGCSLGQQVVSGFAQLQLTGETPISADSVVVTPLNTSSGPGLRLDFAAAADSGEVLRSFFGFSVSSNAGSAIRGASLLLGGSTVLPDGVNVAIEDLCVGSLFSGSMCSGSPDTLIAVDAGLDSQLTDSRVFVPVTRLGVITDVIVDGGLSGSASLGSVTFQLQTIPEPATYSLVGIGLLAFIYSRRSRQ